MRSLVAVALVAGAAQFAAPAWGETRTVRITDGAFKPASLSVARGTKVVWRWTGDQPHNVTVERGPVSFRSTTKREGSFTRKMKRRGTYRIVCTIHLPDQRMKLKVS